MLLNHNPIKTIFTSIYIYSVMQHSYFTYTYIWGKEKLYFSATLMGKY